MTRTQRNGRGVFDRVLIGCGVGCAVMILLTVLAVTFGTMWVFTPGKQAATDVIAGDASLGVVRLHELADDPGTQELFARVLERMDEAGREQQRRRLPDGLRWLSDLQAGSSDPRGLNMMIPKQMTIVFEPSADGEEPDYVVAFNPRTMVRMFKGMFGLIGRADEQDVRSEYAGHPVYRFDEGSHLAFVDSTVLFSNSEGALERAIDRIVAAGGEAAGRRGGGELTASIPEGDWDAEGVVGNETGLVDAYLAALAGRADDELAGEPLAGEPLAGGREALGTENVRLSFGFDIVSAEEIIGLAVLETGDRRVAERLAAELEARHAAAMADATARGLELEIASRAEGERLITELRLVGLGEVIADALTQDEATDTEEIEE